jgi:hypothetical protein
MKKVTSILLFIVCFLNFSNAQKITRNNELNKQRANYIWDYETTDIFTKKTTNYTLFDLWTDEPIFPDEKGNYQVYLVEDKETQENKGLDVIIRKFSGTANELSSIKNYKFSSYKNCKNWLDNIPYKNPINEVREMGKNSNYSHDFFNENNIHNEFDLYKTPLDIRQIIYDLTIWETAGSEIYARSEKESFDNILNGYIELKNKLKVVTENLEYYSKKNTKENIELYHSLQKSTRIIDLSKYFLEYKDKIETQFKGKTCFSPNSNLIFYNISYLNDENFNLDKKTCENILLEYLRDAKNAESTVPLPARKKKVEDCLICYRGKFPSFEYVIEYFQGIGMGSKQGGWAIKKQDYNSKLKLNGTLGYYQLCDGFQLDLSCAPNNFYKIITKAIEKYPDVLVKEEQKQNLIKNKTGLDENFFNLVKEKGEIEEVLEHIKNKFFVSLPLKNSSNEKLSYVGNAINKIPNGFGCLLNEKKQILCEAYWEEGFPIIIYKLNNYKDSEGNGKNCIYYGDAFSKRYANKYLYFGSTKFKDTNFKTYNAYFGDYKFDAKYSQNQMEGYGCYFYANWDKNNLQFYEGNWLNSLKEGKGKFNENGKMYDGIFQNDKIASGTYIWPDKFKYEGSFQNWKEHGNGKKVYKNGIIEEGIFENGRYLMPEKQYNEEKRRKEQERIAEEKRQEEIRINEIKRQEEIRKANSFKFTMPNLQIDWIDNRFSCCCCQERHCQHHENKIDNKRAEEILYLNEIIFLHHKKTSADEETIKNDLMALSDFIVQNYGMYFGAMGASYYPMLKIGLGRENIGSKNKQINIYTIDSKRCKVCQSKFFCEGDKDCK